MTTTARLLAATVQTRLGTLPADKIAVYPGVVPKTPATAYVAYYPEGGNGASDRASWSPRVLNWGFRAVCVGADPETCLWVVDQTRDLFDAYWPDTDPASGPLVEDPIGAPMLPDTSVPGDTRYSITLRFTLTTTRS